MTDCNFSDAIKNGNIRANSNIEGNNMIAVTYDNGIEPDLRNNFSINDKEGHYKKQFGYNDENYTSVTQFMDKSIMYASNVLHKERFSPMFIVPVPSSSQFNQYYCNNLANKIENCHFISDFFQKNLLNLQNSNGEDVIAKMRRDGVPEKAIGTFEKKMKVAAISSIADVVAAPMRKLIGDNYEILTAIGKELYSREKINMNILERQVLNYSYNIIIKNMHNDNPNTSMGHYLTELFMSQTKGVNEYNRYVVDEFKKRISLKIGKKVLEGTIHQMYKIVNQYSELLLTQGMEIKFNKKWKITDIDGPARKYVQGLFIIADKYFNKNHELMKGYQNGTFLIVDEDMDSGTSLKNAIEALKMQIPLLNYQNIKGLVNAYYLGNS